MASEFIGYTILVTLKGPPPTQYVRGIVADVVGPKLVLKDVTLLWNGECLPFYHVDSSTIADLEVEAQQQYATTGLANHPSAPQQLHESGLPKHPASTSFVDPAILSFTKPELQTRKFSADSHPSQPLRPDTISPVMIADSIKQSPVSVAHHENNVASTKTAPTNTATSLPAIKSQKMRNRRDSSATATLTEPFDHMALNEGVPNPTTVLLKGPSSTRGAGKKNRRGASRKPKNAAAGSAPVIADLNEAHSLQTVAKKTQGKGQGWRETPLTEEAPPGISDKKSRRPRHHASKSCLEDTNGWATEDATDIQDLGEFDFEHNLSKFDKRRVFADIRKEDTKAEDERLVNLNRKPRPGTNGGLNLHHSDHVIDIPHSDANTWKSEADDTEEDDLLAGQYSSEHASRRDGSRRPAPSWKDISIPVRASATASPLNGSVSSFRACLRLASTNKPCTCVSPLQMLEIEQLCISELGLSEEIISENAGRGIAEAALTLPPDLPHHPTILFLVGNHKTGSRAVAAARHLRNRNVRVLICMLGGERENMLLESLKRQLDIYRKSGGWTLRWDEFQSRLASDTKPDLIVDALLGMHVTFSELRTDDQAIAFEMIRWANRSTVQTLSVDIPSGLHASSGDVTVVDSAPLIMHATSIACLGAPKSGLLAALGTGDGRSHDRRLGVVDIGISNVAWKKYGTRRRQGIDFGREWVVHLKFLGGGATGALDGI